MIVSSRSRVQQRPFENEPNVARQKVHFDRREFVSVVLLRQPIQLNKTQFDFVLHHYLSAYFERRFSTNLQHRQRQRDNSFGRQRAHRFDSEQEPIRPL
jgi:hypothetical protein